MQGDFKEEREMFPFFKEWAHSEKFSIRYEMYEVRSETSQYSL
jgi:hypothetical protein